MSWTKIEREKSHYCDKPEYVNMGIRVYDMIRCDECGAIWECVGYDHGMQWDPYPQGVLKWQKQSPGAYNDR